MSFACLTIDESIKPLPVTTKLLTKTKNLKAVCAELGFRATLEVTTNNSFDG